jgi:hypothetical protein
VALDRVDQEAKVVRAEVLAERVDREVRVARAEDGDRTMRSTPS